MAQAKRQRDDNACGSDMSDQGQVLRQNLAKAVFQRQFGDAKQHMNRMVGA